MNVGLLLRSVRAARREGDRDVVSGLLRSRFNRGAAAEDDQVGERDRFLPY